MAQLLETRYTLSVIRKNRVGFAYMHAVIEFEISKGIFSNKKYTDPIQTFPSERQYLHKSVSREH